MAEAPLPTPPRRNAPVSVAIEVKVSDSALREEVNRALRAVDLVHDDGLLPKIPLQSNSSLKATLACYHFKGFRPIDIEINPRARGTAFNVLEEIAHFLDHQALGTDGAGFASVDHPELERWRTATSKSAPVKALLKTAKNAKGFLRKRLQEACTVREIFARSYSQYIASKGGDPVLFEALNAERKSLLGDILHWSDAEFEPILKAFDQLFAEMNWI
jgi:hypothetical protein